MGLEKFRVQIGQTRNGNKMFFDMSQAPKFAILGRSGSGKTNMLINLILMMSKEFRDAGVGDQLQFIGVDLKSSQSLMPIADRLSGPIIDEPTQVSEVVKEFEHVMRKRMKQSKGTKIDFLDPEFPVIILVVEELTTLMTSQELTKSKIDELRSLFTSILCLCRSCNMGAIFSSQNFNTDSALSSQARDQLEQKIIMRAGQAVVKPLENDAAELAPAWLLNSAGEFYFNNGKTDYTQGKTWYMSDIKAEEVAAMYASDVRQDLGMLWSPENPFSY